MKWILAMVFALLVALHPALIRFGPDWAYWGYQVAVILMTIWLTKSIYLDDCQKENCDCQKENHDCIGKGK